MKILISGAGIAGPTLAYWLLHHGFEPTLIERAPQLRTGGYIIDFWGAGFEIADRMGLLPRLSGTGYRVREVVEVNADGRRVAGFPVHPFEKLSQGRFISLPRGDLASMIFKTVEDKVETIFGDSIQGIEQSPDGVQVDFQSGQRRNFDLVIGADGLHSKVRDLVFGPQKQFEKYLGYKVAAFEAKGYEPREELTYVTHTEIGQQVGRFAMRDDRTLFLFIFSDENSLESETLSIQSQKNLLRKRFGKSGWECPRILDALDASDNLYFDRVSQIRMGQGSGLWTRGRVSLVGDAASCVSLLAGQGTALAMVAAYILAGELKRAEGDYQTAFLKYQDLFAPFVAKKQRAATRLAGAFAPKSSLGLFLRNQIYNALRIQWVANMVAGRDLIDKIDLPNYS